MGALRRLTGLFSVSAGKGVHSCGDKVPAKAKEDAWRSGS